MKKAKGEIIVINDADWIFSYQNAADVKRFFGIFDNPSIGGISESFPVEWDWRAKGNIGFKMVAYSSYYWFRYQKKNFTREQDGMTYISEPTLFLTNVFRKKLYRENSSLGDDFERTKDIFDQGYKVVLFREESAPHMRATYYHVSIRDLLKQKIRTSLARRQLKKSKTMFISTGYYAHSVLSILSMAWRDGLVRELLSRHGQLLALWARSLLPLRNKTQNQDGD